MTHRFAIALLVLAALVLGRPAPCAAQPAPAGPLTVDSPNRAISVTIANTNGALTWSVAVRGKPLLRPSRIAMTLDGDRVLGVQVSVTGTTTRTNDAVLRPVVRYKRAEVRDRFNERRIDFAGDYSLIVRAYDDGVAYRFVTKLPGDITVMSEDATFAFAGDYQVLFPEETSLQSHQERSYKRIKISDVRDGRFSSLPALVEVPGVAKVAITEADLFDYPGMDLTGGAEATSLKGLFPAYPAKVVLDRDRDERVRGAGAVHREDARHAASFPGASWSSRRRTKRCSTPTSSIDWPRRARWRTRPGSSPARWRGTGGTTLNLYGVPFRAGINTETYKHYIDFAAENHLDYIILDEGWYKLGDLLAPAPGR